MRRFVGTVAIAAALAVGAGLGELLRGQEGYFARSHETQATANLDAKRLMFQTRASPQTFESGTFGQVTAGSIVIPSSQQGFLIATFTGESNCTGSSGWCSVRILCNDVELMPAVGTDFAFDTAGGGFESHTVSRRSAKLGPGTYTCEVEAAVMGGAPSLILDDWTFAVEYWRSN